MNKLLIVAIYDNGWEMGIWYDNTFYDTYENELFKKIKREYNDSYYKDGKSSFENFLKSLDFDEIYVCEDGFIERVK